MTTGRHRPSLRVKTDQDGCRCGASLSDTFSDLTDFGKAGAHRNCGRKITLEAPGPSVWFGADRLKTDALPHGEFVTRESKMDHMTHYDHEPVSSHGVHNMSGAPASHDRHAGRSVAMFRDKFWLSFALTIPVIFWSPDVQHWLGYTAPSFPGSKFVPPVLGTLVLIYGGLVFIRGAWGELVEHKPGMMTLISLAIVVAFGTSLAATFGLFEVEVWWELASLITIMLLGHWLEMRAVSQARGALDALAALLPDTAERVTGADIQSVPLSELRIGDVVLVRPGGRVPADGKVVEGTADVDGSMITGEPRGISKGPGTTVVAGTVAAGGSL